MVVYNFENLLLLTFHPLEWVGLVVGLISLPYSIWTLASIFFTKAVLTSAGFEYHALTYIVRFEWQQISLQGESVADGQTDRSFRDVITVRRWAQWLPWDVQKYAQRRKLNLSYFFGKGKSQLAVDIQEWISRYRETGT